MNKHTVILVDDHKLITKSLEGLINSFEKYTVSQTYYNGAELIDGFNAGIQDPELIVLDVKMPIMGGVDTMKWLHKHKPNIKVLVVSMEDDDDSIINMLRHGAKGYLLKDTDPNTFKEALDTIVSHGLYHTDLVNEVMMRSFNGEHEVTKEYKLKENEVTFIKLACEEKTYKEIADIMCLSPKTIDGYRQQLFEKLNVKNRIGLVIFALRNKLYKLDD
jgi:DNA-binding NarL/FixJ family response regulator